MNTKYLIILFDILCPSDLIVNEMSGISAN